MFAFSDNDVLLFVLDRLQTDGERADFAFYRCDSLVFTNVDDTMHVETTGRMVFRRKNVN